jgi:hypothetical protein
MAAAPHTGLPASQWSPRTGQSCSQAGVLAPGRALVVLTGRATTVPFAAVTTGPKRTPKDNPTGALTCAVRHRTR